MGALESLRARIPGYAGLETEEERRLADEQVRAYAGERLAAIPASVLAELPQDERVRHERLLLRCEFLNFRVFSEFENQPSYIRISGTLAADLEILAAADRLSDDGAPLSAALARLEEAFDQRDSAMTHP